MDDFQYRNGRLFAESVELDALAEEAGTPLYVYSAKTLTDHYDRLAAAFEGLAPLICYSIKSCGNLAILRLLARRGAGMDVVSGGEVCRAEAAGVDPGRLVYAGVGKTDAEIEAALEAGVGTFNIESEAEFRNIAAIAGRLGVTATGCLRVNPDVDPETHAKTTTGRKETKFGVDIDRAEAFFEACGKDPHLKLTGLHLHIGSPVYRVEPYVEAARKTLALVDRLRQAGFTIDTLDLGGGFGADYASDQTPPYAEYAEALRPHLAPFVEAGGRLILEPGRTIAANAGVLLTRVLYLKAGGRKHFVIVDTGMHHLLRPALYDAFHFIWPTRVDPALVPVTRAEDPGLGGLVTSEVVGPICETGDCLARGRPLPPVERGDCLAIFGAGAYGMVMASNYNAMCRPAEVLVEGARWRLIRRRERYEDLLAPEREVGADQG